MFSSNGWEINHEKARLLVLLMLILAAVAAESWAADQHQVTMSADQIAWGPTPPGLTPGAQSAVLFGDPGKEGPFVVRVKAPAGYLVPPHRHSKEEMVTVLSGKTGMAMGETVEKDTSKALSPGGFVYMPGGMVHYAWNEEESVIQISGNGPSTLLISTRRIILEISSLRYTIQPSSLALSLASLHALARN
jgi:quercetin dioxygenase-like cupin family protein